MVSWFAQVVGPLLRAVEQSRSLNSIIENQATTYANRGRPRLWSTRPSIRLILSSVADILIASTLAICGVAMALLPGPIVVGIFAAAIVFTFLVDLVNVRSSIV